jgi:hypothetical protein
LLLGVGINNDSSEEESSSTDEECVDKTESKVRKRNRTDSNMQSSSLYNPDIEKDRVIIPTFSDTIICYSTIEGNFNLKICQYFNIYYFHQYRRRCIKFANLSQFLWISVQIDHNTISSDSPLWRYAKTCTERIKRRKI